MKEQFKIKPYSIEECDIRINHWQKELNTLEEKYRDLEPDKKKPLLHTTVNLLKFWKGYKENYYGNTKSVSRTKSK